MLTPNLKNFPLEIDAADPYIQTVRIGRYKPGVVRLVLDLKTAVVPQAFVLKPVGDYGHRLVLDIYPVVAPDPLMAFLNENATGIYGLRSIPTILMGRCKSRNQARGTASPKKTSRR